jgi:thiamine-phosphate pyrophosphorylase
MTRPTLDGRRLYLCTADRPDLAPFLAACIAGGVDVVQLRDKDLDARPLLARATLAAAVCRDHGVPFIVNDRPDLALEAGADGVHVGQDDAPPALARRILGPDAIVGFSTHAPAELDAAADEPVDYLSAGPVAPTPTKPGRPGTGLGYLRYAARVATKPWFVTGGVTPETVPAMVAAGARRFVVVRWLTEAADPEAAAQAVRRTIDEAVDETADGEASAPGQPVA